MKVFIAVMSFIGSVAAAFFTWLYGVAFPIAEIIFLIAGTIAKLFLICWGGWKLWVYYKEDPPAKRF